MDRNREFRDVSAEIVCFDSFLKDSPQSPALLDHRVATPPVCYTTGLLHHRFATPPPLHPPPLPERAQNPWFSATLSEIQKNHHRYLRHFGIGAFKTQQYIDTFFAHS